MANSGVVHSDQEMECVRLDDIHPSAHSAVTKLAEDLNACREQLALLMQENHEMRQLIETFTNEGALPRKLPKTKYSADNLSAPRFIENPSGSAASSSNSANISNDACNDNFPLTSKDNITINQNNGSGPVSKNKKKIFQAIDTDINTVRKSIVNQNCKHFTLKQFSNKAPIQISVDRTEEISTVRTALENSAISFHEFKWDSEKDNCFIIRGLAGVTQDDIADIRQQLINQGVPDSCNLSLFTTGYMRAFPNAAHNSLLKLVVPPSFSTKLLLTIKHIDHVAVKFEKIKNKSVVQCKNCQRFGHSAAGCKHAHRCVKCGLDHLRDDCPRTHNKGVKLVCCNCGGEHSANNLNNCSYFRKYFAKGTAYDSLTTNAAVIKRNALHVPTNRKEASTPSASYAAVAGKAANVNLTSRVSSNTSKLQSVSLNDLATKIDAIFKLVVKHEALLQNMDGDE